MFWLLLLCYSVALNALKANCGDLFLTTTELLESFDIAALQTCRLTDDQIKKFNSNPSITELIEYKLYIDANSSQLMYLLTILRLDATFLKSHEPYPIKSYLIEDILEALAKTPLNKGYNIRMNAIINLTLLNPFWLFEYFDSSMNLKPIHKMLLTPRNIELLNKNFKIEIKDSILQILRDIPNYNANYATDNADLSNVELYLLMTVPEPLNLVKIISNNDKSIYDTQSHVRMIRYCHAFKDIPTIFEFLLNLNLQTTKIPNLQTLLMSDLSLLLDLDDASLKLLSSHVLKNYLETGPEVLQVWLATLHRRPLKRKRQ